MNVYARDICLGKHIVARILMAWEDVVKLGSPRQTLEAIIRISHHVLSWGDLDEAWFVVGDLAGADGVVRVYGCSAIGAWRWFGGRDKRSGSTARAAELGLVPKCASARRNGVDSVRESRPHAGF